MSSKSDRFNLGTRREFLGGTAALSAASASAAFNAAGERPNVLVIVSDQWSPLAADLAGGNRILRTPAADSIARGGIRFTNAYCAFPLCSPSRASLFTGRMPHEAGVMFNFQGSDRGGRIPEDMPRLGELFAAAGYDTGYFGKEHLAGAAYRGFRNLGSIQYPGAGALADGSALDPVFVRDSLDFIRQERRNPFLAVVSLINPHDICYIPKEPVPPEKKTMVGITTAFDPGYWQAGDHGPEGRYLRGQDLPPLRPNFSPASPLSHPRPWSETQWRTYLANYYLLIENTDWFIGRVLNAVREAGLDSKTLVVFTSDHGEQMGSHQLVGKNVFYQEAARVPLAMVWPRAIHAGQVNDDMVSGIDLLPTLCDYAGIRIPPSITGRSLRPLVERKETSWRTTLVSEIAAARMLRSGTYKYVRYRPERNLEMLFDLKNDPGEVRNLVDDPSHRTVLAERREELDAWMKKTGGSFEAVDEDMRKWFPASSGNE